MRKNDFTEDGWVLRDRDRPRLPHFSFLDHRKDISDPRAQDGAANQLWSLKFWSPGNGGITVGHLIESHFWIAIQTLVEGLSSELTGGLQCQACMYARIFLG